MSGCSKFSWWADSRFVKIMCFANPFPGVCPPYFVFPVGDLACSVKDYIEKKR